MSLMMNSSPTALQSASLRNSEISELLLPSTLGCHNQTLISGNRKPFELLPWKDVKRQLSHFGTTPDLKLTNP